MKILGVMWPTTLICFCYHLQQSQDHNGLTVVRESLGFNHDSAPVTAMLLAEIGVGMGEMQSFRTSYNNMQNSAVGNFQLYSVALKSASC